MNQGLRPLTRNQLGIIMLIARGFTRKQIADAMGVGVTTIDNAISHEKGIEAGGGGIQQKMGFCDPVSLTHWAIECGLAKVGDALARHS